MQAQAQVSAAEDYITARRGAVGAEARTRLAEAGASLVRAQQLQQSDPQQAMQQAQRADQLAGAAIQLAQNDVGAFRRRRLGRHVRRRLAVRPQAGGGGGMLGAVLGGIVINSMLGGGGGSSGGLGGMFGGGGSVERRAAQPRQLRRRRHPRPPRRWSVLTARRAARRDRGIRSFSTSSDNRMTHR